MKRRIIPILMLIVFGITAKAQDYKTGFGLRFGSPAGLNFKYNTNATAGLDFTLGLWGWAYGGGFSLTGLYEIHKALNPKNLRLYYGGGVHLGATDAWRDRHGYLYSGGPYGGIDGVVGLEYTIREIPLSFSLDLGPRLDLPFYMDFNMGFTARYVMNKNIFK